MLSFSICWDSVRAVPQINLMDLGFTLRILGALVAMFAFAPMLAPAMERLYGAVQSGLNDVLASLAVT